MSDNSFTVLLNSSIFSSIFLQYSQLSLKHIPLFLSSSIISLIISIFSSSSSFSFSFISFLSLSLSFSFSFFFSSLFLVSSFNFFFSSSPLIFGNILIIDFSKFNSNNSFFLINSSLRVLILFSTFFIEFSSNIFNFSFIFSSINSEIPFSFSKSSSFFKLFRLTSKLNFQSFNIFSFFFNKSISNLIVSFSFLIIILFFFSSSIFFSINFSSNNSSFFFNTSFLFFSIKFSRFSKLLLNFFSKFLISSNKLSLQILILFKHLHSIIFRSSITIPENFFSLFLSSLEFSILTSTFGSNLGFTVILFIFGFSIFFDNIS